MAESIGYVRQTIFSGLFEFEANEDMADSAYTPKELRPHTDGTYSHDAPGVQLHNVSITMPRVVTRSWRRGCHRG